MINYYPFTEYLTSLYVIQCLTKKKKKKQNKKKQKKKKKKIKNGVFPFAHVFQFGEKTFSRIPHIESPTITDL